MEHHRPADIENTSMAIISQELQARGIRLSEENEAVIKRVLHATADFDYVEHLKFSAGAVEQAVSALRRGAPIITDTNMALAGVSKPSLRALNTTAVCFMAHPEIAAQAKQNGTTRAVAAMEYAAARYPAGIFAVGNAPTALFALERCIGQGLRPSLVVGVPVGFVNVQESKARIWAACQRYQIPSIVAFGRKGGSTVATAILNALLYSAARTLAPEDRGWG